MKYLAIFLLCLNAYAEQEIGWGAGGFVSGAVSNVTITADDQVVDPNGMAVINIDSDNPASNSRSIVLEPGKRVGQRVRLTCRPAGGNAQVDDDTLMSNGGLIKLTLNWVCNQDGSSLNLFFNGTDWEEDSRVIL